MTTLDIVLFLPLIGFLVMLFMPKDNPTSRAGPRWSFRSAFSSSRWDCSRPTGSPIPPATRSRPTSPGSTTRRSTITSASTAQPVAGLLTTFLTPIAVVVSWKSIDHRVKEYFAFLILLEFGLIGVFVSIDLFLFYVFWEIALVPMYFLIGIWGHDRRIYAAVKFFLYTMAGSVLMLGAIIYLYNQTGTFDYTVIQNLIANRTPAAHRARRNAAVPGLLRRLRGQGPAVPAAHLAARRARGSAHRRIRHAGFASC